MTTNPAIALRRGLFGFFLVSMLAVSILIGPGARAEGPVIEVGMPSQATVDLAAASGGGQAGWGDMPGGVATRPYVTAMSVINGDTTTPVIVDGTTQSGPIPTGAVTAVVSPYNLCAIGQTPAPGSCYATPNRVAINVVYGDNDASGINFADPSVPVSPTIDATTVIDMTVALNTLGKGLRWTWANGDLLYWQPSNLGSDNATVRIKFRPATSPYVSSWPDGNGCTATPIFNCEIPQEAGRILTASMVLSLDDTLDTALTGAIFATHNAISGYLQPGGTPEAPTLDIQAASTHTMWDGSPQLGTLEAFIPSAALLNLYGALPSDAPSIFTTTRSGDAGTNAPPTYELWTAAGHGADGLLVTVKDITFSVPRYNVKSRLHSASTSARSAHARTTITARVTGCSRTKTCLVTVYDLGRLRGVRTSAAHKLVFRNRALKTRSLSVSVRASHLRTQHRYLLVVRSAKTKKLIASTLGTVS